MIIGPDRLPRLQIDDGDMIAVESCEVVREVDRSLLTDVVCDGRPFTFVSGQRVTLWAGPSVIFQGRAVDEASVLDLMSSEPDDQLADGEPI